MVLTCVNKDCEEKGYYSTLGRCPECGELLDHAKFDDDKNGHIDKETIKAKYHFTNIPDEEDTVMIKFTGTGINTSNKDHRKFMKAICDIWSGQMYAMTNNIPLKEIKFVDRETHPK